MLSKILLKKYWLFVVIAFTFSVQPIFGQDDLTSVKINIQNVRINAKLDTLSYDVYLQDVDPNNAVAVPGFGVQLAIPLADLGTNAKTVTLSNASKELGAKLPTITATNNGDWLMKFQNSAPPLAYKNALLLSESFPGTRIGTFNIANANGQSFANPLKFTLAYAGATPARKSTVSVFKSGTTSLVSLTAKQEAHFTGLGSYCLMAASNELEISPNPTSDGFYVNASEKEDDLNVFDMNGRKLFSQKVKGKSYVNISYLANGVYIVALNSIHTKVVKK